jgi:DNA-binding transcriptional ArsR family regulator
LIFVVITFHKWNMTTFGDFDGLALFIRIVQAGGLAAAERATGIPKATLSRRLSALEETLNVRLARRTKKGVVATFRARPDRLHAGGAGCCRGSG